MAHPVLALASDTITVSGAASLLVALIKGVVVLLGAGTVVLAMRHSSAAKRHLVWTVGLLSVLLLPLVSLALPSWKVLPEWLRAESIVSGLDADFGQRATHSDRDPAGSPVRAPVVTESVERAPSLQHAIVAASEASPRVPPDEVRSASADAWLKTGVWIWAVVAAALLLRIALSRIVLARVANTASRIEDGRIHNQIADIRRRYGIHGEVHAYLSGTRALPMTWGLFRTHTLLPAGAADWPAGRLDAVLLHELAHVKRRDTITHVAGQVACSLYWVNPLVWLAAWRIHVERERACDDLVVCDSIKASDYAEHLLRVVGKRRHHRAAPCLAVAMAKTSQLEGRVVAILDERLNRKPATRGFFTTVLVAGFMGVIAIATLRAQSPQKGVNKAEDRPRFGDTIELVMSDETGETPVIDFDRGKVGTAPAELKREGDEAAFVKWMAANGYDAVRDTNGKTPGGLIGFDMVARIRGDHEWDAKFSHITRDLSGGDPESPVVMAPQALPATYFIRTREGGTGILQFVRLESRPRGLRIRVKMLGVDPTAARRATSERKAPGVIRHVSAFLDAVSSGKHAEAENLAGPEFLRGELYELKRISADKLTVSQLYVDSGDALAITSPLSVGDAGGKRVGRLVLTWRHRATRRDENDIGSDGNADDPVEVAMSWRLRDVDFESDESLQREIARFLKDFPDAVRLESTPVSLRRYVRLVVGPDDQLTLEGRATTWQALPTALARTPHRASTVLEFAISTEALAVARLKEIQSRAAALAKKHGFEYSSYVGVYPLGSVGSPARARGRSTRAPRSSERKEGQR